MLRYLMTALTLFGALQAVAGLLVVRWFAVRSAKAAAALVTNLRATSDTPALPAVSILKPICGDEVLLEQAIASFCRQDYAGPVQLLIGAQDPHDPALAVAQRVRQRFPGHDIAIVVDGAWHGCNRKIANLMNMMPLAKHDILVLADSDLHVRPDYLRHIVATLQQPGCGLVTTACGAEPAAPGFTPLLGVAHITHSFLPSALIGAAVGRQDCLGGTMALRRETLAEIGGLPALVNHLADDNVLGSLVRRLGQSVLIAPTLPVVVVQERQLRALWQHELRWARTIGAVAPIAFAGTIIQFPLFWAALALLLSGGAAWAVTCFLAAWGVRAAVVWGIDHSTRGVRARPAPAAALWLLPVRDFFSVAVLLASFWNDEVVWRGHVMRADRGTMKLPEPAIFAEDESLRA